MTANLAGAITNAYDLSSILRVCTRALEGDAPEQPGDGEATAHTVKLANNMIGDLISTLEQVELSADRASPDASQKIGAVGLLDQWKAARRSRDSLVKSMRPEQKGEPAELGALDLAIEGLAEQISRYQPRSDEDAAAMLEWCVEDCAGELFCEQYPRAQWAAINYLRNKS